MRSGRGQLLCDCPDRPQYESCLSVCPFCIAFLTQTQTNAQPSLGEADRTACTPEGQ